MVLCDFNCLSILYTKFKPEINESIFVYIKDANAFEPNKSKKKRIESIETLLRIFEMVSFVFSFNATEYWANLRIFVAFNRIIIFIIV